MHKFEYTDDLFAPKVSITITSEVDHIASIDEMLGDFFIFLLHCSYSNAQISDGLYRLIKRYNLEDEEHD